jgi:beta-xylosidase
VYDRPIADPFVLEHDGTYYLYGTAPSATEFETASSTDLVTWEPLSSALRALPGWSFGNAWAPEVVPIGDSWVMYYTAGTQSIRRPDNGATQCITVAVSDSPAGPFVDDSQEPLVCQAELGGSIDATFFRDTDGTPYLIWKNDGNCCRIRTHFYLQELSDDGQELLGEPVELEGLVNEKRWEDAVIEAPTLIERDGTYYMFYSGGFYASAGYAVGYATSDALLGPYTDAPQNPILETKAPAAGPGHQAIIEDTDGDLWMAYHAWDAKAIGEDVGGARKLWLDELTWDGETPVVHGPDEGPQPVP